MPAASSQKQIPLRHCVISALPHSKLQGGMYHDEPTFQTHQHHQQPPQSVAPVEVATTLWPQPTSNYWFPNWRELFHGFIVVQGGQPRQAAISSFQQNQVASCTQQHTRSSPSPCSKTPYSHLRTNDPTRSTHQGAPLAQPQQISSPFISSSTNSRLDDPTWLPHPRTTASHAAAQSPILMDPTQKGDVHITYPSPSSRAPAPLTKYTIKSPFWLPQGWVTEIQIRRTGTAADKYYKHLMSGRRFRSRNEVLQFIRTGKGRTRKKRDRRKTSLALAAASLSLMNNFAHKKHTTSAASKLFSQSLPPSSSENRHPTHVENPLLTGPRAEWSLHGETGPPSKQYICFSASHGIEGPESGQRQLKRPIQEKTQKLPVKKKAKTLSPKTGEDKQTSKLWHWFKRSGAEMKPSEMAEQRNDNDLSLKDAASQKSAQLGREIQAAHRTVVQMSKEMQATVEKLSREIREAQKDVELSSDLKLPIVPAEMDVASSNKIDVGRKYRDMETTSGPCTMSGSAIQASHRLHSATNHQAKWSDSVTGHVSHVIQKPVSTTGFLRQGDLRFDALPQATNFALTPSTRERSCNKECMSHATQPAIWPDITSHQPPQMACASRAAKRVADTAISHVTQPAEATFVAMGDGTQAAQLHTVAPIHVTEPPMGDAPRPAALWSGVVTLNAAQPTQIANSIEKSSDAKAAEKCGFVNGYVPQPGPIAHFELNYRTQLAPESHVNVSSRPAEVECVGMAQQQRAAVTEKSVSPTGHANAPLDNPGAANALGHVVPGGGQWDQLHASVFWGVGAEASEEMGMQEEAGRHGWQDRKARRLRRKMFAAVLNPKLDLSRLNPGLTARQRAKAVQRMKTRHARELLATLGLHLCRKAIRRKP